MTVTLFDEIHQNRQGSSEGLAKTTSSRSWRVVTNNRYDDDVFVIRYGLSSNLLPQLSAQLSAGFGGAGFRGGLLGRGFGSGGHELLGSGCLRLPRRWRRWWW